MSYRRSSSFVETSPLYRGSPRPSTILGKEERRADSDRPSSPSSTPGEFKVPEVQ